MAVIDVRNCVCSCEVIDAGVVTVYLCRRLVEQLEVEHCLAEARRMAQLAVQESTLSELKQTGDELARLSLSVSSLTRECTHLV